MVENSKKIIDWSLEHSEELFLQVEYYTGLKIFFPSLFDIGIFIKINEKTYYGRGSDENEEIAYCKALSEAIERSVLEIYKLENSNGLAVHPDLNIAISNAQDEIIERDAFFCHYFLNRGFFEIKISNSKIKLENCNSLFKLSFYELCKSDNSIGVLCSLNGKEFAKPFGNILGTAYGRDLNNVAEKALVEALRMFTFFNKNSNSFSISEQDFLNLKDFTFSHHGKLALDLRYSEKLESFFSNNKMLMNSSYSKEIFKNTILNPSLFPIPNIPLFFVKSSSDFLQDIFTGPTVKEEINWNRLNQLGGGVVNMSNINLVPHPFD